VSRIAIVEAWDGRPLEGPLVRWDLAVGLFAPDQDPGSLADDADAAHRLGRWFWERMGQVAGRLRPDAADTIWVTAPRLDGPAREYVTRLASFWSDHVHWLAPEETAQPAWDALPNRWIGPVVSVFAPPPADSAWQRFTAHAASGDERMLGPLLGIGRAFMKVQIVEPGRASARLHSHSAVDEYYLVLAGRGTLRVGGHVVPVEGGALVGKAAGPDLPSQFVADRGEALTILDMEIWPEASFLDATKDVVAYTSHGELYLHGPGWQAMAPQSTLGPIDDARAHYNEGYVRAADGSFEPRTLPGMPPRS
jgi:uncharacterized cupin superfamily protein